MTVDCCFSPALFPYYSGADREGRTIVIVDIFRASTTICAAFSSGATQIKPVATIEEAKTAKENGFLVGAERNTQRCDFADFGNSPKDFSQEKIGGKQLVFTTTNGTQAIDKALTELRSEIVIGAFANLPAVVEYCAATKRDILVVCAGWNNKVNKEDSIFAGALIEELNKKTNALFNSDSALIAYEMWMSAKTDVRLYLGDSEHIARLKRNNLESDIAICLEIGCLNVLPIYDRKLKALVL